MLNTCIGAVVFTAFGSLWAVFGVWSLGRRGEPFVALILTLAALLLLIVAVKSLLQVSRWPQDALTPEVRARVMRIKRAFKIVNLLQGLAIGAAFTVGFNLHHPEYIPPVIALIVGLHFFALAPILRMRFDYVTGALLCGLALATMFAVPVYANTDGTPAERIFLWGVVNGLGGALVLWLGAFSRLLNVRAALRR